MIDTEPDERSQQAISWRAVLYTALGIGFIFLLLSKGNPWASAGVPTRVMGRPLFEFNLGGDMALNVLLQMGLAFIYTAIVAAVVYRFRAAPAMFGGAAIGLILYGINYLVFHVIFNTPATSEAVVLFIHVVFCLFAAAAYKGLSVPRARAVNVSESR